MYTAASGIPPPFCLEYSARPIHCPHLLELRCKLLFLDLYPKTTSFEIASFEMDSWPNGIRTLEVIPEQ